MIDRFERFIFDITEIDLYWHRLASGVMKEYGLKGSYVIYLTKLGGSENGLTSAELGAACGRDKADVSRDLNSLEKARLVERVRSGESSYRALIRLTEAGREVTKKVTAKAEQAVDSIGSDLDDRERAIFYKVLDQIRENMRVLSEKGLDD